MTSKGFISYQSFSSDMKSSSERSSSIALLLYYRFFCSSCSAGHLLHTFTYKFLSSNISKNLSSVQKNFIDVVNSPLDLLSANGTSTSSFFLCLFTIAFNGQTTASTIFFNGCGIEMFFFFLLFFQMSFLNELTLLFFLEDFYASLFVDIYCFLICRIYKYFTSHARKIQKNVTNCQHHFHQQFQHLHQPFLLSFLLLKLSCHLVHQLRHSHDQDLCHSILDCSHLM